MGEVVAVYGAAEHWDEGVSPRGVAPRGVAPRGVAPRGVAIRLNVVVNVVVNVVQIVDYLRLQLFSSNSNSKLFVSLAQRLLGLGMTAEESVRTQDKGDAGSL